MKVVVELGNCYGIKALNETFDFTEQRVYSIYAPNGFMKTSFSRTMNDLSKGEDSRDVIFPDRVTSRMVKDGDGNDITPEQLLVIEPYNPDFYSDKASMLLVNQGLKEQYDKALNSIEEQSDALFRKLKQLSGLTSKSATPQSELLRSFGAESVYDLLEELEPHVAANEWEQFSSVTYAEIFNDKTIPFLDSGEISSQLEEYMERYDALVEGSPVLSKSFNHYHANQVQKTLSDNGFFAAKHTVNLFDGKTKEEFISAELLNERLEEEKTRILSDPTLAKKFNAIDKKIGNADLRKFRDYLQDNREIIPELANYKELQKKIWIAYLAECKDIYSVFLTEYRSAKQVIKESVETAKKEETQWRKVVDTFNQRFTVPFHVEVSNQDDVILKGTVPQLSFTFTDEKGSSNTVDKNELLKVLSQGERRALYILNLLFEITSRQKIGGVTIMIVDDIADSFDYKNKYAIIEYLKEISKSPNFYSIFLTHNFDFYRALSMRLNIWRDNRLFAIKRERNISLVKELYQKDPFAYWKQHLEKPKFTISAIPFVRNLADYCEKGGPDFSTLTSLLHVKKDTKQLTIKNLENTFKSLLRDKADLALPDPTKLVFDLIFETADKIQKEDDQKAELESKIVLSIAIRLKAEEIMIRYISDDNFVDGITENQTTKLIERFCEDFSTERELIDVFERVNLITPENIHLNSFMYEPILDMSAHHLKEMYSELLALK